MKSTFQFDAWLFNEEELEAMSGKVGYQPKHIIFTCVNPKDMKYENHILTFKCDTFRLNLALSSQDWKEYFTHEQKRDHVTICVKEGYKSEFPTILRTEK